MSSPGHRNILPFSCRQWNEEDDDEVCVCEDGGEEPLLNSLKATDVAPLRRRRAQTHRLTLANSQTLPLKRLGEQRGFAYASINSAATPRTHRHKKIARTQRQTHTVVTAMHKKSGTKRAENGDTVGLNVSQRQTVVYTLYPSANIVLSQTRLHQLFLFFRERVTISGSAHFKSHAALGMIVSRCVSVTV